MNYLLEVCLVATLALGISTAPSVGAQSPATAYESSSFAGMWEGRMNDLPAIRLHIQEADSEIRGDIVFYLQERDASNGAWYAAGESAGPLLAPQVKGKTFTFEVQHHRCHGCTELGPNVKFRMTLAGSNEARLWKLAEATESDPGLKMIRRSETTAPGAQALQKGISVQLPVTRNAIPMPDADKEGSLIISVTSDGSVYVGITPVNSTALVEKIKTSLSNRTEKKLYIKADARTPYANVLRVLEAVRSVGVESPSLLTEQTDSSPGGTLASPKALQVLVGPSLSSATVVRVLNSGRRWLKINNEQIPWGDLESKLRQLFENRGEKVVQMEAEGTLRFADVVAVTDMCRATGAKVVLVTPGL